jgi:hypothetical protein
MNVFIHQFRVYDITIDEYRISRRWATREAIERIHGEVIEGSVVEVDATFVDRDGMTERNFDRN